MKTVKKLSRTLLQQDFSPIPSLAETLEVYKKIAWQYAHIEHAIAVLSDMTTNSSFIYYGDFAQRFDLKVSQEGGKVYSIWEEEVLRLVHPDDLERKYIHELRYFQLIKQQPKSKRKYYTLMDKLRMKDQTGHYLPVLHRLFYIPNPTDQSLWLALCLYSPLIMDFPEDTLIVHSLTGEYSALNPDSSSRLLSERERQILKLIEKGFSSKRIAEMLSISIHTVNRHRQEILKKLQVKNSIEACKVALKMKII